MKKRVIIGVAVVALAIVSIGLYLAHPWRSTEDGTLRLYGNVELREVALAFDESARIATVAVQEGDTIHRGQVVATLDTSRLRPAFDLAVAGAEAQNQIVARAHAGSRPQEIAQARANLAAILARVVYDHHEITRLRGIAKDSASRAVSKQELDSAEAALAADSAQSDAARQTLDLAVLGPRKEDVARDEALARQADSDRALAERNLDNATLVSPIDGIVRTRLLEPGDMASPTSAVFSVARTDPKWVRVYVDEVDLPRVRNGMKAIVTADGLQGRQFAGWVGFISPQAEFTPKAVETPTLRTSLVYEARIFVQDPHDDLRLGMPATVVPTDGVSP